MKITPKPGDYVRTERITDEQYHAVVRLFIDSGAGPGEYGQENNQYDFNLVGWDIRDGQIYHIDYTGTVENAFPGRELSLSDLLGDGAPAGSLNGIGQDSVFVLNMLKPISEILASNPVWDGEGLPPVGAKCEFFYIESLAGVWQACTIDFIGNNIVVLTTEIASEISVFKETIKFRPLKSEREIAIEELEHFTDQPCITPHGIAVSIYDAGYRKIKDAEK
jgi:hypothetical protein